MGGGSTKKKGISANSKGTLEADCCVYNNLFGASSLGNDCKVLLYLGKCWGGGAARQRGKSMDFGIRQDQIKILHNGR